MIDDATLTPEEQQDKVIQFRKWASLQKSSNKKSSVLMWRGAFFSIFSSLIVGSNLHMIELVGSFSITCLGIILFLESFYCKVQGIPTLTEARADSESPSWFKIVDHFFDFFAGHVLGFLGMIFV